VRVVSSLMVLSLVGVVWCIRMVMFLVCLVCLCILLLTCMFGWFEPCILSIMCMFGLGRSVYFVDKVWGLC